MVNHKHARLMAPLDFAFKGYIDTVLNSLTEDDAGKFYNSPPNWRLQVGHRAATLAPPSA